MEHVSFTDPAVQVLDLLLQKSQVSRLIAAEDEMYQTSLALRRIPHRAAADYFMTGLVASSVISQVIRRLAPPGGLRLLDLAAGYGRITRFLVEEFGSGSIDVADVQQQALAFQHQQFGVRAFLSTVNPRRFVAAPAYDAVVAISLFTHLPRKRFHEWLERVASLLAPDGVFVFTVHDQAAVEFSSRLAEEEVVFVRESESSRLRTDEYGSTWVSDRFVRAAVRRAFGEAVQIQRIARAFSDSQDLYVVIRAAAPADVDIEIPLVGEVNDCSTAGGAAQIHGWAVARGSSAPLAAIAVTTSSGSFRTSSFTPRPDVADVYGPEALDSGWTCQFACTDDDEPLVVRAISASGAETPLFAGMVRDAKFDPDRVTNDLRDRLAAAQGQIWELRVELAALQGSRFWTVRQSWLRAKRLIRRLRQP